MGKITGPLSPSAGGGKEGGKTPLCRRQKWKKKVPFNAYSLRKGRGVGGPVWNEIVYDKRVDISPGKRGKEGYETFLSLLPGQKEE